MRRYLWLVLLPFFLLSLWVGVKITSEKNRNFDSNSRAFTANGNIEYGFTTHLSAAGYNLDINAFKKNIDDLIAYNQNWIRFNITDFEVATSGTPNNINWNNQNLAIYDEAIDYAKSHNLKIYFATNVPIHIAKDYSLGDYKSITSLYYRFLANRYKGKVDIWQIFNEADTRNYRDYSVLGTISNAYLDDLWQVISVARQEIKQIDPNALITTNATGYPINDQIEARWVKYFDVIASTLDVITLDIYPDINNLSNEIATFGTRINNIKSRYSKDVIVGETGVCTRISLSSEQHQIDNLPRYIDALKQGSPSAILIYEIQDENNNSSDCEGSFGIKNYDGSKKSSYQRVMDYMQSISTTGVLNLSYKLQGVVKKIADRKTTIIFKKGQNQFLKVNNYLVSNSDNGIYLDTLANITPDTYDVYIKPEGYLQKKFTGILVNQGNNNWFDRAGIPLKVGDFDGNNILNITDIAMQLSKYTALSVPVDSTNRIYDINGDNKITISDIALPLSNYTALSVFGE